MGRCKRLLQGFTVARTRDILFSDEKILTLNPVFNSQNEGITGDSLADATAKRWVQESAKQPHSIVVWGGVTSSGKTLTVFVEAGVKINAAVHKDILEKSSGPIPTSEKPTDAFNKILLQHTKRG
ncbi:unnamed protein product [Heligmosomoides polygyrus]|uniref:Zeta_toxin domain-containing protein n=1 Tax=Heligmosomoides polygyrus TaxID=6339 RepID=A0A183G0E6_HELPZ|nr:unnamed protein product [Heligmosomoides polygyrus]